LLKTLEEPPSSLKFIMPNASNALVILIMLSPLLLIPYIPALSNPKYYCYH
jgi:hypothetical protein